MTYQPSPLIRSMVLFSWNQTAYLVSEWVKSLGLGLTGCKPFLPRRATYVHPAFVLPNRLPAPAMASRQAAPPQTARACVSSTCPCRRPAYSNIRYATVTCCPRDR
ncbi:hypothetical protein [Hyphomonas sp.]|uniref:hypothetical protein n=1 Tax=Hyphomonas sp. TaxID=87 RepID=UPI003565D2FF